MTLAISSLLKSCLLLAKFGTKQLPLFSPSHYKLYAPDGVKRGISCTLLRRVLLYSILEYTSWLMNRTLSCTACIVCWSFLKGWIVRWAAWLGPSHDLSFSIFHPWLHFTPSPPLNRCLRYSPPWLYLLNGGHQLGPICLTFLFNYSSSGF